MRPDILFPLFAPVTALPGVGKRTAEMLEKAMGSRVRDLMLTPPSSVTVRQLLPNIASAADGDIATLAITVGGHSPGRSRRQPYKITAMDESGSLDLVFFHARGDYLRQVLPEGTQRVISGKIEKYQGAPQMTHPDYNEPPGKAGAIPACEPNYPLTQGLSAKMARKAVAASFDRCPPLAEWLDPAMRAQYQWPDFHTALASLHHPQSRLDAGPDTLARKRLAYDELLARQLALALARAADRRQTGRIFAAQGDFGAEILAAAPFTPTAAQTRCVDEICKDLSAPYRMARLLQGDVGAGKTFVAAMAAAHVCEAGAQVAIMAPTEILARQLQKSIAGFLSAANLDTHALTGRDKGPARKAILSGLAGGHIDVICGTHALFQDGVEFANLGLVIIDEQHRFGVRDRLRLSQKGQRPDLLVMTATPIPRTLALSNYGDLDISRLDEKPKGRLPIDTRILPAGRIDDVAAGLGRKIQDGAQIYWVCPLVEDSEMIELTSAEERFRALSAQYPGRVGLLHGRMKGQEKEAISQGFKNGQYDILVATTVIEVGVDAPGATIMVIEHAERYGLAQLHQLRGRVGRNDKQSTCLLIYKGPLGTAGKARLQTIRETEDGFKIAEEDWALRGSGDLLGAAQSGLPRMKLADLDRDKSLLEMAAKDARLLAGTDPRLQSVRGEAARILLYLFEQDVGISLMNTG